MVGRGRARVGTRRFVSVVLRVAPVGGGRGSSPRVAVVGGLRCVATRRIGLGVLRPAAPVARAPRSRGAARVARNRGGQ
ncbi:hypothetical protein C1280_14925 [Gemmata obscuriglobus]|uniref:Uncharacterized protein n=1 Tax=Gemmata obscuriglobus TaxID=114 RepID=A0A2Z3GUB2_9BACT|nr:hypothetical protein C1280_10125 [Gemmata obscuriglobus]AWM37360.1 hypothetical protein C1280_10300 [Gemmata obscuriglobus]AWM42259.1 hypothetical protein C1280_14925 [Gemmata obscuriglobus]